MNVAHIGSRGFPGFQAGVEKSLEEICPRLAARGHKVTLYCSDGVGTAEPVYKNTLLRRMPAIPTKHLETLSRVAVSSLDAISKNYDIIHFHSIGPALFSWLPRASRCKTVVTVHGLDWQRAKWGGLAKRVLQLGERSSVYFPHQTIVVSKFLKRYYLQQYNREVEWIPNGVNIEQPSPPKLIKEKWGLTPQSYILFASRLVEEKACHDLIRAFGKVRTDKRLVIAGASWHSDAYEKTLHALAANDERIIFTGWAEGSVMKELYSNAYVFCLPSQIEGLSLALLEAMGHGVCPLVSDIRENLDVVEDKGVSFKVNDEEALAQALQKLIDAPEMAIYYGVRARKHVAEFYSWDNGCALLESAYEKILNGSVTGGVR